MAMIWDWLVNFFREFVWETVKGFTFVSFVDIVVLALIFYFLYRFVRDRRAGKLLFGLGMILLLFVFSSVFHMHALNFVFQNFYQVGLIAIIVMFQPELRAALEKVGGAPLTGLKNITAESKELARWNMAIDDISLAASDLSRDKVGALIVIEQTTKLGDYAKSGVIVDAALSPHILRNLFFNNAPLHDGAVIIRDGRVYAAGCFLPLTTKTDIDKDLGTRHRAAIGVSENSDAIVIVVSEETGQISIAMNGSLQRNYNYATLKQALNANIKEVQGEHHVKKGKSKKHEKREKKKKSKAK